MKKQLPKAKKSLKTFILEEDAKIIDKTASKIAITASFVALSVAVNADDANACRKHGNHSNHSNNVGHPGDFNYTTPGDSKDSPTNKTKLFIRDNFANNDPENHVKTTLLSKGGQDMKIDIPPKAVGAIHGNHYNHSNGKSQIV